MMAGCQVQLQIGGLSSEVASFETNFFRIAGTSKAEISVRGKGE